VDGNLVSARTWNDNTLFLKQFVQMLKAAVDDQHSTVGRL
jgi:putative intracellular protease/amidase